MSEAVFLSKDQLLEVFSLTQMPTAIHVGEDAVIQFANDAMLKVWGKDITVIGKPLEAALPELKGQPFIDMFKRVWNHGLTLSGTDTAARLEVDGEFQIFYFDFEYRAIKDVKGKTIAILHTAIDVTNRMLKKKALDIAYESEVALEREQTLNEELSASNEELNATIADLQNTKEKLADLNAELESKVAARVAALQESNNNYHALNEEFSNLNEELATIIEELSSANEELLVSRKYLEVKNAELADSEGRFRSIISQAPVAICVIRAHDLMILDVNEGYLEIVGRSRKEIENRTVWDAISEAADDYAPILQDVIQSGVAFVAKEHEIVLHRNGKPEIVFLDFVYEPITNSVGAVEIILVVVIDVTDKVKVRHNIEDVEQRIRLAVEASEMGTFEYDYVNDTIVTSDRFNAIFGYDHGVSRDKYLNVIHADDVHLSAEAHENARQTGKMMYEARLIHSDGSLHWMRVQANVYFDDQGKPIRLLGTLLDITEFKHLQHQKDDFISIASHELKTPITTLKASLQLLDGMKANPSSAMLPRLIEQSNRSMGKISELVEDLLNVSRMNEGQINLTKKKFNLSSVINDCCSHIRAAGNYELVFHGDTDLEIVADEHRIDQVLVNLVNNAVKYAPNSKKIYLTVENLGNMAKVSVKDYGPGINAKKLPHLFDRYYRVDDTGYQVSGLGLGLYISADIIQRHGGQIGVESEEGGGSTFWFTIPL